MCCFQFKFSSSVRPRKLKFQICSIGVPSILRLGECTILCVFLNIMNLNLVAFSDNRVIFIHSDILTNYLFIFSPISLFSLVLLLKYLQGLNSVVSSACIINLKILLASGRQACAQMHLHLYLNVLWWMHLHLHLHFIHPHLYLHLNLIQMHLIGIKWI